MTQVFESLIECCKDCVSNKNPHQIYYVILSMEKKFLGILITRVGC